MSLEKADAEVAERIKELEEKEAASNQALREEVAARELEAQREHEARVEATIRAVTARSRKAGGRKVTLGDLNPSIGQPE